MPEPGSRALGSRYELIEQVGQGAMGEVWRAWDRVGGRTVAAKVLHQQFARDVAVVGRFVQERSILMDLHHPNIVSVLDLVVEGHDLAIVMEFVEGGTLAQYRRQVFTLPPAVAVPVVCGVLSAVAFAHEKGVLHRDIKSENVLLTGSGIPDQSSVRLTDFGIARIAQDGSVRATGLLGTPAYMSPELLESGVFSQASDVYAVGVLLYELLAGRTPFEGGDSPMTVGMRHVFSLPPRLPVDDQLWQIIATMLDKDPQARLSAGDTLAALGRLPAETLNQQPLPPQPQPEVWESTPRRGQLDPWRETDTKKDVGATFIPAGRVTPPPLPDNAPVMALEPEGDANSTRLGTRRNPVLPVVPEPVQTTRARKRPPTPMIVGGSVLAVVIIVVVVFLVVRGLGPKEPPPIAYTPGHIFGDELPTGLTMDFEADKGTEDRTVGLTVVIKTNKLSGLTGDILLAFPSDNGQCPQIVSTTWDSPVVPVTQSQDAVDAPCGHKTTLNIKAGSTQRLVFVLSGVTTPDLGPWLTQVQSTTTQVLREVVGSDFALQRLTGVRVTAQSVLVQGKAEPVPYEVFPVWPGQTDTTGVDPLFTYDTLDYQATDLLRSLTGGQGLAGVTVTSCSQAEVQGHRVLAEQPTQSCQMEVQVGAINPAQASFSIRMPPS